MSVQAGASHLPLFEHQWVPAASALRRCTHQRHGSRTLSTRFRGRTQVRHSGV